MSNDFVREARYVVLKSADVMKCLTVSELIELRRIQAKVEEHRAGIGNPPLDCVVVEKDWPEYEPTWRAIEARVTGAQPAPSVPDGWLRAIDEALVVAHIGVANAHDTYEQAKAKLDNLLDFHVDVATDPAVNGGYKLVPIVSTHEMDNAGVDHCDGYLSAAQAVWNAMLAAAPGSSRDDQHAGGLKALNHQGLMERARQNAKKEAGLIYPDDDARREEKEQEIASEYYRQYTTPNP